MKLKVAYIFTTFPKSSETFLQREVRGMAALGIDYDIYSLWGGKPDFEKQKVNLFPKYLLLLVPLWLCYWGIKKTAIVGYFLKLLFSRKRHSWENFGENLMGAGFGLLYARYFKKKQYTNMHASWASMPAMAAWVIQKLTDIPFSMGAHAYDVFEYGGDAFLKDKAAVAKFVHTSTEAAKQEMVKKGISGDKIKMIRRGLLPMPDMKDNVEAVHKPLRVISIGRLVEKKGYSRQLRIYKALQEEGIPFCAKIVGEGPLWTDLVRQINSLALDNNVEMTGWQDYKAIEKLLDWADVFLFTGVVAQSGDRDGFPNVVGEAMAKGVPIVASTVSALPEVIRSGENGFLIEDYDSDEAWVNAIKELAQNKNVYTRIAKEARGWIEEHFDAKRNAGKLAQLFEQNL